MTVDVVIPTYKPDRRLFSLLRRLERQTYPIEKIIIINTEKEFLDEDYIKGISNLEIHHIRKNEFDHGGTRNYGMEFATSDLVLMMTQDAVPAGSNMIQELVKPFDDKDVIVTYGRQLPAHDCSVGEAYTRKFNYPDYDIVKTSNDILRMGIKAFFSSDVCAMYRRIEHKKLGGFPNRTIINEDSIFAAYVIQTGKKVYYAAKAEVIHSHNYTYMQQFHRNFDLAVSQADHPEVFGGIRSESEGLRLIRRMARWLIRTGNASYLPQLFASSAAKYAGYLLGKHYRALPAALVKRCSMNRSYWENAHE